MIDVPIFDTHVHLLDTRKFKYSWASGAPKLARDGSDSDLATSAKPHEMESSVFVEVDVDLPQYVEEGEWVQSIADSDPRLKGCVACLPMEQGVVLEPKMARLAELKVMCGVRRLMQAQPGLEFVLKPDFRGAQRIQRRQAAIAAAANPGSAVTNQDSGGRAGLLRSHRRARLE